MAGYYTDKKLPGVGISIGLTRLFYVLEEQAMLSPETVTAPADVLVIPMTEDISAAISAATLFRDMGIRTQLYRENKKFKAKMSYADKIKVPFVALLGEDEIREGVIAVKDMQTGQQLSQTPQEAAQRIIEKIAVLNSSKVIKD